MGKQGSIPGLVLFRKLVIAVQWSLPSFSGGHFLLSYLVAEYSLQRVVQQLRAAERLTHACYDSVGYRQIAAADYLHGIVFCTCLVAHVCS